MSPHDDRTALCARVLDRLVEGGDVAGAPLLGEHLGSCVTCFRAMTELRDAPRVAEALRAQRPASPGAAEQFWDELAARTTDAALAALGDGARGKTSAPSTAVARARRSAGARTRIFSVAATLAMAASGFLLVARHSNPTLPSPASVAPGLVARGDRPVAAAVRARPADSTSDEEADVADLDAGALQRLLDRLRPSAPAALTASSAGSDSADVIGDDEGRVNEELADLDGDELRRVASSLAMGAP
jgi:hypothetical protein